MAAAADSMTLPRDIHSAVTAYEAAQLARLARGQTVLELGAHYGFSTIVLAQAAERVHSVDTHHGDAQGGHRDTLGTFVANLARYEVTDRVVIHVGRFEDVLPVLRQQSFDGCFIDGYHSAAAVRRDLSLALPLVRLGGWIAFHDYGRGPATGHPTFGVTQVADEFGISGVAGYLAWGDVSGEEAGPGEGTRPQ